MYNLVLATEEHIDVIMTLGKKFFDTHYHKHIEWDEDSALAYAFQVLDMGFYLLVQNLEDGSFVGLFGALITPFPLNNNANVCTEIAWYLEEGHRDAGVARTMVACAEEIAKQEDCKMVTLSSITATSPERIELFYKRLGYKEVEKSYVKMTG